MLSKTYPIYVTAIYLVKCCNRMRSYHFSSLDLNSILLLLWLLSFVLIVTRKVDISNKYDNKFSPKNNPRYPPTSAKKFVRVYNLTSCLTRSLVWWLILYFSPNHQLNFSFLISRNLENYLFFIFFIALDNCKEWAAINFC